MKKSNLRESLKYFKAVKIELFGMTLFYIVLGIIGFISPIIEAHLITSITSTLINKVILIALGYLVIKVFEDLLWHFALTFWKKHIRTKILFNIRKELVDNILELRLSNFDKYSTGMFQERIKNDPQTIARVVNAGQRYLMECIAKVGVIIYVMCINWLLGLIYLGGVVLVTIIDNYSQAVSKEKNKLVRQSDENVNGILSEVIRGIRDIKLLDFKNPIKDVVENKLDHHNNSIVNKDTYDSVMGRIKRIILLITVFLVVVLGIKFVDLKIITAANLITLYLYNSSIFSLMDNFTKLRSCLKEYELAVDRIFDLYDDKNFPKDNYGNKKVRNIKGNITFENVTFGYTKNKKVLNNLSLEIKAKDNVAIIGSSGSGKTTIFNLLTKSYLLDSGIIKIDEYDINDLDEDTIRKNISIITQSPYIFNMTIKENLLIVSPKASMKKLDEVCKKACFYDYVMSLPDKYDTIIGEGGINLSGGQKQRLAIARSLLKECKILLFDEATSALDNVTQNEIQKSIDNISQDYTVIIIAHRLSTIKNCNKIYMLENGKIKDSGTHKDLLKKNKTYQKLYNSEEKLDDEINNNNIFMEEKIDKEPYIKVLTKDKVINLTGQSGSGKSYYAKNNFDSDKYLVVDTDDIFDEKRFNESSGINRELGELFRKKYVELPDMGYKFDLIYKEILDYCKKYYKDKIVVIDCAQLYCIKNINNLKGKIIIMRTSVETCLERVINRYKKNNPNHTEEELNKYIKRKKGIYVWYKYFNEFINKIDNL